MIVIDHPISHVARLSLNRPEKHNAFNSELINELKNQLNHFAQDDTIRVIILRGAGKHFSAGADIEWMKKMVKASEKENREDALQLADLMHTLYVCPKPTVAQVQGAAMGGAVGLVACCDIAIAEDESYFSFSEVKIGLIPAVISPYILKAIGERATRRYFMTAEKMSASEAQQLGLIHDCVTQNKLEETVLEFAKKIMANAPKAVVESKQLIQRLSKQPLDETVIKHTAELIAKIRISPEGQEGLTAFLEKREPKW